MKPPTRSAWLALTLALSICGCLDPIPLAAADFLLPPIIQAGFDSWTKGGGFDGALYVWQKGGLMEGNRRIGELSNRLQRVSQAVGGYVGHEVLKTDPVGKSSLVVYLSLNFQRGAVFARFVLYHTEKAWVVQDMDFSTRPEAIMPWLSFAGERMME